MKKEEKRRDRNERKEKEEEKGEADAAAGLQKPPKDREPQGVDAAPTNPRGSVNSSAKFREKQKRERKPKDKTEKTGGRKEQERRKDTHERRTLCLEWPYPSQGQAQSAMP